jgi:hypothetical protein
VGGVITPRGLLPQPQTNDKRHSDMVCAVMGKPKLLLFLFLNPKVIFVIYFFSLLAFLKKSHAGLLLEYIYDMFIAFRVPRLET